MHGSARPPGLPAALLRAPPSPALCPRRVDGPRAATASTWGRHAFAHQPGLPRGLEPLAQFPQSSGCRGADSRGARRGGESGRWCCPEGHGRLHGTTQKHVLPSAADGRDRAGRLLAEPSSCRVVPGDLTLSQCLPVSTGCADGPAPFRCLAPDCNLDQPSVREPRKRNLSHTFKQTKTVARLSPSAWWPVPRVPLSLLHSGAPSASISGSERGNGARRLCQDSIYGQNTGTWNPTRGQFVD